MAISHLECQDSDARVVAGLVRGMLANSKRTRALDERSVPIASSGSGNDPGEPLKVLIEPVHTNLVLVG